MKTSRHHRKASFGSLPQLGPGSTLPTVLHSRNLRWLAITLKTCNNLHILYLHRSLYWQFILYLHFGNLYYISIALSSAGNVLKIMMIGVVFPLILLFIRASTESLSRAIHVPSERGVWAFPGHHLDSNWSHLPGVHVICRKMRCTSRFPRWFPSLFFHGGKSGALSVRMPLRSLSCWHCYLFSPIPLRALCKFLVRIISRAVRGGSHPIGPHFPILPCFFPFLNLLFRGRRITTITGPSFRYSSLSLLPFFSCVSWIQHGQHTETCKVQHVIRIALWVLMAQGSWWSACSLPGHNQWEKASGFMARDPTGEAAPSLAATSVPWPTWKVIGRLTPFLSPYPGSLVALIRPPGPSFGGGNSKFREMSLKANLCWTFPARPASVTSRYQVAWHNCCADRKKFRFKGSEKPLTGDLYIMFGWRLKVKVIPSQSLIIKDLRKWRSDETWKVS